MGFSANEWKMDEVETFYQTEHFGGSDTEVAATELFSDDIDLTAHKMIRMTIKVKPSDSTNDMTAILYSRHDDLWTGNEAAWKPESTLSNAGTEKEHSYIITEEFGPGHYRWGLKSGLTTTFDVEIVGIKGRTWTVRRNS